MGCFAKATYLGTYQRQSLCAGVKFESPVGVGSPTGVL